MEMGAGARMPRFCFLVMMRVVVALVLSVVEVEVAVVTGAMVKVEARTVLVVCMTMIICNALV